MNGLRLDGVFIHPLKSGRAVRVARVRAEERGPAGDRRWMLTDDTGRFLSQREEPRLAQLCTALHGNALTLSADGLASQSATPEPTRSLSATIWDDTVAVHGTQPAIDAALSSWLERPVRLVHLAPDAPRPANRAPEVNVSLADGYPYLIAATASLAALNSHLETPLPMDRFRPNLVIAGGDSWQEDRWRRLRIGTVDFQVIKPCARCVVTTTDQHTGERRGPEPLSTLAALRRDAAGKLLFGINAVAMAPGELQDGAPVTVLESEPAP